MDQEIEDLFRLEAQEHIESMEAELLKLESDGNQSEGLDTIFRALHTLKGSGNMAGFANIGSFVHNIESKFAEYRKSTNPLGATFVNEFLEVCDILREMLKAGPSSQASDYFTETPKKAKQKKQQASEAPKAKEATAKPEKQEPARSEPEAPAPQKEPAGIKVDLSQSLVAKRVVLIEFKPSPQLFIEGQSIVALFNSLGNLGNTKIVSRSNSIPSLNNCDPELCYLDFEISLESSSPLENIVDVFSFMPHGTSLKIDGKQYGSVETDYRKIVPGARVRGLHCKVGSLDIIVPEFCLRACRPPEGNIARPLGIATLDGKQETVIDLPTLFDIEASQERVLVLVDFDGARFCLAVENFEDFVEGDVHSGGYELLTTIGTAGFVTDKDSRILVILDMEWFVNEYGSK